MNMAVDTTQSGISLVCPWDLLPMAFELGLGRTHSRRQRLKPAPKASCVTPIQSSKGGGGEEGPTDKSWERDRPECGCVPWLGVIKVEETQTPTHTHSTQIRLAQTTPGLPATRRTRNCPPPVVFV